jgi:hypothetical protein
MEAVEFDPDPAGPAFGRRHPLADLPGRVVAHVLAMAAHQVGHPVAFFVEVEAGDLAKQCLAAVSGREGGRAGMNVLSACPSVRLPVRLRSLLEYRPGAPDLLQHMILLTRGVPVGEGEDVPLQPVNPGQEVLGVLP